MPRAPLLITIQTVLVRHVALPMHSGSYRAPPFRDEGGRSAGFRPFYVLMRQKPFPGVLLSLRFLRAWIAFLIIARKELAKAPGGRNYAERTRGANSLRLRKRAQWTRRDGRRCNGRWARSHERRGKTLDLKPARSVRECRIRVRACVAAVRRSNSERNMFRVTEGHRYGFGRAGKDTRALAQCSPVSGRWMSLQRDN